MARYDEFAGKDLLTVFMDPSPDWLHIKESDALFKSGGRAGLNIFLEPNEHWNGSGEPNWFDRIEGYKDAADRLIEDLIQEDLSGYGRYLGHPILSLYRHSIELALKSILVDYCGVREFKKHGLVALWAQVHEAMLEVEPQSKAVLLKIGELIAELDSADPDSTNFRFGVDRTLKPLPQTVDVFDGENLRLVMNKISSSLGACATAFDEARKYRERDY